MASETAARAGDEHARSALSIVRHCPFFPPNTAMVTLSFAIGQGRMVLFPSNAGRHPHRGVLVALRYQLSAIERLHRDFAWKFAGRFFVFSLDSRSQRCAFCRMITDLSIDRG